MAARIVCAYVWLCLLMGGLLVSVRASAEEKPAPGIVGVWQGTLDRTAVKLRVVVEFKMKAGGGFTATMDSPDQGAFGMPIDEVTILEKTVKFTIKQLDGSYAGQIRADGQQIDGQWTQGGASRALVLKPGA